MTGFVKFRDRIRQFIISHETLTIRVWDFLIGCVGLIMVQHNFGYQPVLNQWWLVLGLAILCAFLPIKGISAVILIYGLVQLSALSTSIAAVALALVVVMLAICWYFRAKNTYNLMTVPICYELGVPFAVSLGGGFLRNMNELSTVICGGILSYYLKTVKENASSFLDQSTTTSVSDLINSKMLGNQMFYFYMVAMIAMFLVVFLLRTKEIDHAWLIASMSGILVEFVIMVAGYLFTGNEALIPSLLLGNIVLIVVGLVFTYFILDLDYSRVERVQFEDDDYYYYVTAVPKVKVAEAEMEIKKITEDTQTNSSIRHSFRRKERE